MSLFDEVLLIICVMEWCMYLSGILIGLEAAVNY
jgi:hypothetical protein